MGQFARGYCMTTQRSQARTQCSHRSTSCRRSQRRSKTARTKLSRYSRRLGIAVSVPCFSYYAVCVADGWVCDTVKDLNVVRVDVLGNVLALPHPRRPWATHFDDIWTVRQYTVRLQSLLTYLPLACTARCWIRFGSSVNPSLTPSFERDG